MSQELDNITKCQENPKHINFMKLALEEADKAEQLNEVPIGAIVVFQDKIIAKAHNTREHNNHFHGHAEFLAMMKAQEVIGDWRLEDCDIYVTLEPCAMCAGAMLQARVKNVYYGAKDPKAGAVESKIRLFDIQFNHKINACGGILEQACQNKIKTFFTKLRK